MYVGCTCVFRDRPWIRGSHVSECGPYLGLEGGQAGALHRGVGAPGVSAQQGLTVHLGLQAGDVAAAEVLAEVAHLLQLQ